MNNTEGSVHKRGDKQYAGFENFRKYGKNSATLFNYAANSLPGGVIIPIYPHDSGHYIKDFAVVANEIRKLSEITADQSRCVGRILKEIVDIISDISESSRKAGRNFGKIQNLISTITRIEEEVKTLLSEQGMSLTTTRPSGMPSTRQLNQGNTLFRSVPGSSKGVPRIYQPLYWKGKN